MGRCLGSAGDALWLVRAGTYWSCMRVGGHTWQHGDGSQKTQIEQLDYFFPESELVLIGRLNIIS